MPGAAARALEGPFAAPLLAAAAACAAHAPALRGGFVWLDHAHLEAGLAIVSPERWADAFTRGFAGTGYYRPLTSLSLSVDAWLGGAPAFFHAHTLAWHAAAAACSAIAARALGLGGRAAALAGALVAVHPIGSVVASAIAFRSEAMATVAVLVALIAARRPERWAPWLAAVAIFAGGLAKETALVLAPIAWLVGRLTATKAATDAPPAPRATRAPRARLDLRAHAPAAIAVAGASMLRLAFAPSLRARAPDLALGEAIGTRLAALARAAAALVPIAPIDRSICDALPIAGLASPPALVGLAAALALALAAWRARGPARAAVIFAAIACLPIAQLVPVMRFWSVHYAYTPLAIGAIAAAAPIAALAARRPWATPLALAALAVLAITSARSAARFRDDRALWAPEVALQPACREGHFYLGEAARARGALEEAAASYEAALAPRPGVLAYVDRAAALQNLGIAAAELGELDRAEAALRAALAMAIARGDLRARRELEHNLFGVARARASSPRRVIRAAPH